MGSDLATGDVEVQGLRIAYRRAGDGPPLVLLHGAVCDSRVWRAELDELADAYSVIAWDAPGCGASSDPPESFRLPDFASSLAELLRVLDVGPAHLLGHSWGSALALQLYRQAPAAVTTLILVGAYAGWAGSLPPDEVDRRLTFALRVAELPEGEFEPTSMPGLFSDAIPADRARELASVMSEIRPVGTRVMAKALAEADLRGMLQTIDVPTLLLYGQDDERSPLHVAEALRSQIPTSTLVVVPGAGHEVILESADRFHAEVRGFLRANGGS